jgi:hypothetical protein
MLGLFVVGLIGVIGLIIISLLALFIVPFFAALIPVTLVGLFLWTSIRWLAGLVWFIVMGAASILHSLWHSLF